MCPCTSYLDTGMNREGMPIRRALPWMQQIARQPGVRIDGTYHMFVHDLEFDRVQLTRFKDILAEAAAAGYKAGVVHAAPTFELYRLPESHFDMVRVGNALFGAYPGADVTSRSISGRSSACGRGWRGWRTWSPARAPASAAASVRPTPTRVALLPVGHTDGYPISGAGKCEVLIGERLYPSWSPAASHRPTRWSTSVSMAPVKVGDIVTLVGPERRRSCRSKWRRAPRWASCSSSRR